MKIIRDYKNCPNSAYNSTLVIGNFDAIHKGHQNLLKCARSLGAPVSIFTFYRNTKYTLGIVENLNILSFKDKVRKLSEQGVECFFLQRFNKDFAKISAADFVRQILVRHLKVKNVVVGDNFFFGRGKEGNVDMLRELAKELNFGLHVVTIEGSSSSNIRELLKSGKVHEASTMLGYDYSIKGRVIAGKKRGSSIGMPTANIQVGKLLIPKLGVYAAKVYIEGLPGDYTGVVNLGSCPTFNETDILLEVHILDFNQDIYGKKITVIPIEYIRDQQKFDGIDSLVKQIKEDIAKVRAIK